MAGRLTSSADADGPGGVHGRDDETVEPSTCSLNFRALQQFFGWLVREEEIDRSPMERMRPPSVPEQPVPVLSDEQLRTLFAACDGRDFVDRRDSAIIRMFLDTGCRRRELAGLTTTDVSLHDRDITVIGKGSRQHRHVDSSSQLVLGGIHAAQMPARRL